MELAQHHHPQHTDVISAVVLTFVVPGVGGVGALGGVVGCWVFGCFGEHHDWVGGRGECGEFGAGQVGYDGHAEGVELVGSDAQSFGQPGDHDRSAAGIGVERVEQQPPHRCHRAGPGQPDTGLGEFERQQHCPRIGGQCRWPALAQLSREP